MEPSALLVCLDLLCRSAQMQQSSDPPPLSQEGARAGGVVKLTRPDGTPIYINPRTVAFIRGPLPGETGHTTVVFSSGAKQTVQESVDDIAKIMEIERRF